MDRVGGGAWLRRFLEDERGILSFGGILREADPDALGGGGGGGDVDPGDDGGEVEGPSVLEVTEDAHLQLPGYDEPIPYSEFDEHFIRKPDYTRQRQKETQELQEARNTIQQLQERTQRYEQWYRQQQQGGGQQPGQQGGAGGRQDPFQSLMQKVRERSYVAPDDLEAAITYARGAANPQMMAIIQSMSGQIRQLGERVNEGALERANERIDNTVSKLSENHGLSQAMLRDAIEATASREGWQPGGNESFEEFAARVAKGYSKEFDQTLASRQKRERQRAEEERKAGLTGPGGRPSPGKKVKRDPSTSIDELIAEDEARGMWND